MLKRKWGRRRDDDRVARKEEYAPIQDSDTLTRIDLAEIDPTEIDDLAIPACEADPEPVSEPASHGLAPTENNASRIVALVGATGGVGTTSLATQLAHEFALSIQKSTSSLRPVDPRVCLIDLDFEAGACAHHLDLLPSLSLEDLCGPADQIDTAFTSALVSTHESGISLLAAPNTAEANARINPRTVMAVLDAAADLYDIVIIDMPRYRQPWSLPILQAVDMVGIICELTIPSLQAGREQLGLLAKQANGSVNAQAIIGKYERRSFKNTLKLADAERALGREVFATLCLDPDTIREALNCGEPAGALKPDSRFVKDVRLIANTVRRIGVRDAVAAA